jgi:AraC-like DNA-binding protein
LWERAIILDKNFNDYRKTTLMAQLLNITHADVYTKAEVHSQTALCHWLGLVVSGTEYAQVWRPDGRLLCDFDASVGPHLLLRLPGMATRFKFSAHRENWIIQFELPELTYDAESGNALWQSDGNRFELPFHRMLKPGEVAALQREMSEIRQLYWSKLPRGQLAAALKTAGVLARFLEPPGGGAVAADRVARFRALIDDDVAFRSSLQELAARAGGNVDSLRRSFRQRYQLDPGEYRTRHRVQRIMAAVAHTELSIKEIADQVGMAHVTHLHRLIRTRCGVTPRELIQQYRGRAETTPPASVSGTPV